LIATLDWHGHELRVDLARGVPIAIPLDPHGPQPSFFTGRPASASPLRSGDYIGNVRQGGSCNAEVVKLVPHCHGTHTECIGHLLPEPVSVLECIYPGPVLARLLSLTPEGNGAGELEFPLNPLQAAIQTDGGAPPEALVIRTLPNDPARPARDYATTPGYPVLAPAAMALLAAAPFKHLLVDTPSLDRAHDGGRLANHRSWWGMDGSAAPPGIEAGRRSVTEMVFVPDALADGLYWMHLELSPLVGDATPSRPVLYPLETSP